MLLRPHWQPYRCRSARRRIARFAFPIVEKIIEIFASHVSFVIHSARLKIAINASLHFQSFVFRFFVRWSFENGRCRPYAAQHDLAATVRSRLQTPPWGPFRPSRIRFDTRDEAVMVTPSAYPNTSVDMTYGACWRVAAHYTCVLIRHRTLRKSTRSNAPKTAAKLVVSRQRFV